MSATGHDVAAVAERARIYSATEFEIDGMRHGAAPKHVKDQAAIVPDLCNALYSLYCRQAPVKHSPPSDRLAVRRFIAGLSEANTGSGTWDPDWRIVARDADGRFEVTKDDLTFWVSPEGISSDMEDPQAGSRIRIRIPKEMRALLPGFYLAIGDAPQPNPPPRTVTRMYWHLTAEVAGRSLALLTSSLNRLKVPFRFKLLADPQAFTRADAGILYLDRAVYLGIRDTLVQLHRILTPSLLPEVPLFVKPLGRGLGVSEDPGNGESFGQHRCRLIAEGLCAAWRAGSNEAQQRVDAVRLAFSNAGIDSDRPYLAAGSSDPYVLSDDLP